MANKPKNMHQIREIFRRKQQGESNRSIARTTGFSRSTILEYFHILDLSGYEVAQAIDLSETALQALIAQSRQDVQPPGAGRKRDMEVQFEYMDKELSRTGVTRLLLWQEYKKENPAGYSYTQFCYHFGKYKNIQQATAHFEHKPAEFMQVDYAGDILHYIDQLTGEQIDCQVLVCTLPYSGYTYVEAMHTQQQEAFIAGLNHALYFFGGVPLNIRLDNLKSGVKKANRYDPEFTDLMMSFGNSAQTDPTSALQTDPCVLTFTF